MAKFKHSCAGFRPIVTDGSVEVGRVFAERFARREYGKRGAVGTCRLESWSPDGRFAHYGAFVGVRRDGGIVGSNYGFTVETERVW